MNLIKDGVVFKKTVFTVVPVIVILALGAISISSYTQLVRLNRDLGAQKSDYEKSDRANAELKNSLNKAQQDLAKLQRDHAVMLGERDELLVQVKGLLLDRNLARELEGTVEKSKQLIQSLEEENQVLRSGEQGLTDEVKELETIKRQLLAEKEQLAVQIEELKTKSAVQRLERENAEYRKQNVELISNLKKASDETNRLRDNESKAKDEVKRLTQKLMSLEKEYTAKFAKLDKQYAEAVKTNELLERRIESTPTKFATLAKQHKTLVKETARMHYNLGVFYNKQKQYTRAVAEFEKALELAPDDAYSYFNLGYLYAEYVVNRPKAIQYFKKYLQYAKRDDKDVDWAKRYIITWEAWQGSQPQE